MSLVAPFFWEKVYAILNLNEMLRDTMTPKRYVLLLYPGNVVDKRPRPSANVLDMLPTEVSCIFLKCIKLHFFYNPMTVHHSI